MSELSRDDIRHLSHLARLELSEEEYALYAKQLTTVVGYVEQLHSVDTAEVQARGGVTGLKNVLAEDVLRAESDLCAIDHRDLIEEAPLSEGNFIEVRAVLAGEEESA